MAWFLWLGLQDNQTRRRNAFLVQSVSLSQASLRGILRLDLQLFGIFLTTRWWIAVQLTSSNGNHHRAFKKNSKYWFHKDMC